MLHVIQSQRIELLLAGLIDFFADQPIAVFEPRQILVPSSGVGEWLRYQLADHDGICAQVLTDFIGSYQWKLYKKILKNSVSESAPLSANVMQWRIFGFLHDLHSNPDADGMLYQQFEILLNKVKDGTPTQIRRQIWGLSEQVAQVFAAYVVYRPEWLQLWGQAKKLDLQAWFNQLPEPPPKWQQDHYLAMQPWQAKLWEVLFAEVFSKREAVIQQFWDTLAREPKRRIELPSHLVVFSMVQLPAAELNFLKQLSQYCEIQLLHYNPSQEYWADSVDPRWLSWYAQKHPERAALRDSRHPLLTRLGKQARDVFGLLSGMSGGEYGDWQDVFPDQYPSTLLGHIQQDILQLNNPADLPKIVLADDDQSLVVHLCHSALRQLEVLRDEVLTWLAADARRRPSDILVLAPNLQAIKPLINAVFAPNVTQPNLSIPFEITGLATPEAEALWKALMGCFDLLDGRFGHDALLDWLSIPAVQTAYQLTNAQVQRMGELLIAAGFRRGFDALHLRNTLSEQDTDTRFSFRFALDRLLLGMMLPTDAVHAGRLSWPSVQPEDYVLIATLQLIYQQLHADREHITRQDKSIVDWLALIEAKLNAQFIAELDSKAWTQIKYARKGMRENLEASELPAVPLPLRFVLDEIEATLSSAPAGSKPTGRLTFARLGTLRPLPYQVIVMLGLEAGQFPARDQISNFDLIKALPAQAGDRSRQEDEQGAFLDALLLAQQACWIFYNGFDVSDVHPRQPAAPVQELLDLVASQLQPQMLPSESATDGQRPETALELLTRCILRQQSLLPFERINFTAADPAQPRQQSVQPRMLADLWFQVAQQLYTPLAKPVALVWASGFAGKPLRQINAAPLRLEQVIRQLLHPAAYFLQQARIQNIYRTEHASTFEPLTLNSLDQYQLRRAHLQATDALDVNQLVDRLPVGAAKDAYYLLNQQEAQLLQRRITACTTLLQKDQCDLTTERLLTLTDAAGQAWHVQIEIPADPTQTWLSELGNSGRGKHRLRAWLQHLAWQVYRHTSASDVLADRGARIMLCTHETYKLPPISAEDARQYLLAWLSVWQQSAVQPWVLPPDLVLDDKVGLKYDPKAERYDYKIDDLQKKWSGEEFKSKHMLPAHEDESCCLHPDWRLLLQGQDPAHALNVHLAQHAERLYAPLVSAWQVFDPCVDSSFD